MQCRSKQNILKRDNTNGWGTLIVMSSSLCPQRNANKITLIFHLIPVRMDKIKKTKDRPFWWKYGTRIIPIHSCWQWKFIKWLWKSVWWFLWSLGIDICQDPALPLLGIYLKNFPSYYWDTCSIIFISCLFIIPRNLKQPRFLSVYE